MKRTFVIHPFLFAVSPILFLFFHNIYEVSFSEILLPITIVLGFATLLLLLLKPILKDNKKAGIILSIFFILFFSYGHVRETIFGWTIGDFAIGRQRYLLPIWCILFVLSSYFIIRMHKDLCNLTNFLNITAVSFVVISIISIGVYEFKKIGAWQINNGVSENIQTNAMDLRNLNTQRDIYYIILDSYMNSSILKDIYKYDNYEFTDYLTKKGFYIGFKSRSNYPLTTLSLASSLNMEYINYISDILWIESRDLTILNQMVANNKVMNFLKSKGYKFISIGYYNKYADINFQRPTRWNDFTAMVAKTTMLGPLIEWSLHRKDVLFSFSKLTEIPDIEGPKFVFAHINCPHPPFVFNENGESVPQMSATSKKAYINQLIFVNKKTKVIIDDILSRSKIPPVIILQADHGTRLSSQNFKSPNDELLRENMSILNAYYLPPDGNRLLYNSISPVNTFRLIFNYYFDTNYELLNDLSYYTTGYKEPYKLTNVTGKIKYD